MLVPIRDLKKLNECYFKRTEAASKVYKINHYDRSSKKYSASPVDDIHSEIFIKSSKEVFIGFTY